MIICCGEALIDMLPRTTEAGEAAFAPHVGGAVFNTAIALGRLGAPVGFFSGISSDFFGDALRDALRDSSVDARYLITRDRPATLAFVRLVDGQARYAFYDENTAGRMLTPDDLPVFGNDAEALFFGGISLVAEPCGSAYETLMTREAARGRVIMLDPNIRRGFISDEAAYRARIGRMIAAADIVKISDEDLAWIAGPGDIATLAKALLEHGPRIVIVTCGSDGAMALTRRHLVEIAAQPVTVVDTVGAGDTFNAGVLAHLSAAGHLTRAALADISAADLEAAVTLGAATAAVTVSRAGANPPWRRELDRPV